MRSRSYSPTSSMGWCPRLECTPMYMHTDVCIVCTGLSTHVCTQMSLIKETLFKAAVSLLGDCRLCWPGLPMLLSQGLGRGEWGPPPQICQEVAPAPLCSSVLTGARKLELCHSVLFTNRSHPSCHISLVRELEASMLITCGRLTRSFPWCHQRRQHGLHPTREAGWWEEGCS